MQVTYGIMLSDDDSVTELAAGGHTLGIDAKAIFVKGVISYHREARVVLFTDGLFEVYGSCPATTALRMKQLLQACSRSDMDCFMDRLEEELHSAAYRPDDICVIVMDVTSKGESPNKDR
ncbi:SpoIIE family protein phosphatase [Paenibacillus sp. UNC451MF]|uniref:SpoIIE family protein phosphatase n=1 Tax=Paenibacillus sp. UNC451MF TaxID=1449063 RepID=UPI000491A3EF|nr:SpoIIE family protein phosphatase [Paenibacillus sp. UNC451MF]